MLPKLVPWEVGTEVPHSTAVPWEWKTPPNYQSTAHSQFCKSQVAGAVSKAQHSLSSALEICVMNPALHPKNWDFHLN